MFERLKTGGGVVAAGGVPSKRPSAVGRVVASGGIAFERLKTTGSVGAPGCVAKERVKPVGRVVVAGGVGDKCLNTGGRVPAAGGVVTERIKTNGGIAPAACQAKERKISLGGVEVGIASVRWRIYRFRPLDKRKGTKSKCDENESGPERRMVRSELWK